MADDFSATIIPLYQQQKKRPMTSAERGRSFRERRREKAAKLLAAKQERAERANNVRERPANVPFANTAPANEPTAVRTPVWSAASILLGVAALGLGMVGITINAWFARSLGASDVSGWLFLAIGVAADLVALAAPSCAGRLWQARRRATAAVGWGVWAMTFAFAVTAGIGFASVNITDVTLARTSRVTPAVTEARLALGDAMAARDRECHGGVGKFCREREGAVVDRRQALDAAMHAVAETGDPQAEAAIKLVAWISLGALRPTGDDFGMLRLALLALLPQIGGVLLMIRRQN